MFLVWIVFVHVLFNFCLACTILNFRFTVFRFTVPREREKLRGTLRAAVAHRRKKKRSGPKTKNNDILSGLNLVIWVSLFTHVGFSVSNGFY